MNEQASKADKPTVGVRRLVMWQSFGAAAAMCLSFVAIGFDRWDYAYGFVAGVAWIGFDLVWKLYQHLDT